jgi:hypothetical protein
MSPADRVIAWYKERFCRQDPAEIPGLEQFVGGIARPFVMTAETGATLGWLVLVRESDTVIDLAYILAKRRTASRLLWQRQKAHKPRGSGAGTRVLTQLCAQADVAEAVVSLSVQGYGSARNADVVRVARLAKWYRSFGFVSTDPNAPGSKMIRKPRMPPPEAACFS